MSSSMDITVSEIKALCEKINKMKELNNKLRSYTNHKEIYSSSLT